MDLNHTGDLVIETVVKTAAVAWNILSSAPSLATVAAASLLPGAIKQLAHFRLSANTRQNNTAVFVTSSLDQSVCAQITSLQLFTRSSLKGLATAQLSVISAQDALLRPRIAEPAWSIITTQEALVIAPALGSHQLWESEKDNVQQFGVVFNSRSRLISRLQVGIPTSCLLDVCP